MNATQLSTDAVRSTYAYLGLFAMPLREKLALGYIADWLYQQDEDHLATAAGTANEAIRLVHAHFI